MNNEIEINNRHKKANEYKNLCIFAEDVMKFENNSKVFGDWKKLESFHETKTNFKGILYSDGQEYVICYLGTDSKSIKDHIENLVMGIFGKNIQMRLADYFYKRCKEKFGFYNDSLTIIGHSEGGTEATYTGIKNNIKTVTFNTFGISRKQCENERDYTNLITNYRDESDLVSKLKENIGQTFVVPSIVKQCFVKRIFGSLKSHKIANFGDCENAVLLEDFKKLNPCFIDTYKIYKK